MNARCCPACLNACASSRTKRLVSCVLQDVFRQSAAAQVRAGQNPTKDRALPTS
jgi:hypothetical protein